MNRVIKAVLLVLVLAALTVLVPSPGLVEEWTPDLSRVTPIEMTAESCREAPQEGYLSETEYADASLHVTVEETRYCETTVLITRVKIADPSQLRTSLAGPYGTSWTEYARTLAKRVNAVLAINGDYYCYDRGIYASKGLVVRNGKLLRSRADPSPERDALIVDTDGDLHIVQSLNKENLQAALDEFGGAALDGGRILHAFTFGPALVIDGEAAYEDPKREDNSQWKKTQRMVFAQDGPLSYVIVCCEGPENKGSEGLTLKEMTQLLLSLGVKTAYNLDGGSSSSLVFGLTKINALSAGKTRDISDIIYFASAQSD